MSKAELEFNWWKNYLKECGDTFTDIRKKDWADRSKYLRGIEEETGIGLDYGSGLMSMLEFSSLKFDAIDPIMDRYNELIPNKPNYHTDTNKKYDWIWCVNVLDHTKNPQALIDDIKNKLKPGGRLYLEVNLDKDLGDCHYSLFNKEKIADLVQIEPDYDLEVVASENQNYYYARYTIS